MLSKKKSRPIHVDGYEFRWAISPDSGYIVFVAESSQGKSQKIEVYIDSGINRFWVESPNTPDLNLKIIKPKDAASIIRQALSQGWNPEKRGRPLQFDYNEDEILIKRI